MLDLRPTAEIGKTASKDREARIAERDLLTLLLKELEDGKPIRDVELNDEQERLLRGYQFLTAKPLLLVINISEAQLKNPPQFAYPHRSSDVVALSGKVEAELAQLDDEDASAFMEDLGISTAGFPNMFMILGPNGPFTNLPPSIETQVDWIGELIGNAERNGMRTVEPTPEAEDSWTATCEAIANMTLFPQAESWIFGSNIPGKKSAVMFYMAGIGAYRQKLGEVADAGYEGFAMNHASETASV